MNELTKGFSDAYAPPWTIKHYGEFDAIFSAGGLLLCYVTRPRTERKQAAMSYIVQCANLMPEAVKLLNEADTYMTSMLAGLCNDCPDKETEMCRVCKLKTVLDDMETFLAKLEGGNDNEPR